MASNYPLDCSSYLPLFLCRLRLSGHTVSPGSLGMATVLPTLLFLTLSLVFVTFIAAVIRYLKRTKKHKGEQVSFGSWIMGKSVMTRTAWCLECGCLHSQEAETHRCDQLIFLLLIQSRTPAHGTGSPTFKRALFSD